MLDYILSTTYRLPDYLVFWIFVGLFAISVALTVIVGYILSTKVPTEVKGATYECGQPEDIHPHEIMFKAAERYFAYAMAFFVLDVLAWVLFAAVPSVRANPLVMGALSAYTAIVLGILIYYLKRLAGRG